MNSFDSEAEQLVFEKLRPDYEKKGFRPIDEFSKILPSGLHGYVPDFVFTDGNQYIAFEVKNRKSANLERSLEKLKKEFEKDKHWKFIYIFFRR